MMMFHPVISSWIIISIGIVSTILFIWFEWGRPLRFRALRIAAIVLMMVSLCLLLLRPYTTTEVHEALLLLTPGYSKEDVDSVLSENRGLQLFHTAGTTPYQESKLLSSFHELERQKYPVSVLAGEGLPSYAHGLLKNQFTYLPAPLHEGTIDLHIPRQVTRNAHATLSGIYYSKELNTKLYLESPSGKEDSATFTGPGSHSFTFSFVPTTEGRILYSLATADSAAHRERIPIDVERQRPLNIIIAQGFPTFEIQYLKNFLASRQHRVAVRYQLSKKIFRTEYVNRTAIPLDRFGVELLNGTDVLILDDNLLAQLSTSEKGIIGQAVRNGLGLLLLVSGDGKTIPAEFMVAPMSKIARDTATLSISSGKILLPVASVRVQATGALEPVLQNGADILSGYKNKFNGRVGFQLLKETYRLKLSGDSIRYSLVWSPLIERVARRSTGASRLSVTPPLPVYPDEPLVVELVSDFKMPSLQFDSITIPLKEDVLLDNVWGATVWASEPGWHRLVAGGDSSSTFVFKTGEWNALRVSRQMKETERVSKERPVVSSTVATTETEIRSFYFFIGFLVGAGFLWLAPKL